MTLIPEQKRWKTQVCHRNIENDAETLARSVYDRREGKKRKRNITCNDCRISGHIARPCTTFLESNTREDENSSELRCAEGFATVSAFIESVNVFRTGFPIAVHEDFVHETTTT